MSATLERRLREAHDRFGAGDLAGAERACGKILQKAPRHPGALHLLGMTRLAAGNAREAVALINRALDHDPDNPMAMENLGLAHLAAGDPFAAEPVFRRALKLGASHASLHMRLGLALLSQGRSAEAVTALLAAAEKAPDDPDVRLNLGNALAAEGRAEEALACYRTVIALRPDRPDAHFNLGTQLRHMGRLQDAETAFRAALAVDPRYTDAHHNLGVVYQELGRLDDAAASYRAALTLVPHHVHAQNNLGNVLMAQGRIQDAEKLLEAALKVRPDYVDACINLGNVRREQGRYPEAQALYDKAISLDPGSYDAHYNLGDALWAQGDLDKAVACYERSLALNPGFARAQYNLGLVRLFRHEFEQGWVQYEHRTRIAELRRVIRLDPASVDLYERLPCWRGPGEAGVQDIAVWSEQGIGDQVLFSTLIPEMIAAGVAFLYEVDRRLLGVYERAFPGTRFVPRADPPQLPLQQASRVLLAGSLPGLFRRGRSDFVRQPAKLFSALPDRVRHYEEQVARLGSGLKVALSWRSTRKDYLGPRKNVALMEFAPLLKLPGAHFLDVQYGDTAAERTPVEQATGVRLQRFEEVDYRDDLEELLAILEACDLLITTSNATAHLAGALGKRTWLLFPADVPPFHYWAHDGSHRSLWYPAVEIVSAPRLVDWRAVIRHTADKLGTIVRDR